VLVGSELQADDLRSLLDRNAGFQFSKVNEACHDSSPFEEQLPLIVPGRNCDPFCALKGERKSTMQRKYWGFLALLGSLIFLVLFIADRQRRADVDKLSEEQLPPRSSLEADPNLKLVTERSPYMRTER